MMDTRSDWKEYALLSILFAGFTLAAIKHGWTQIDAFGGNVDPSVFIREAHEIARTGELITSRDAPVRYFPLAFIYTLTHPTGVIAEQIASLHAAFFSFVVLPAGIASLAYVAGDRYVVYLSLVAFGAARLTGFGASGFQTGAWQYDIAAPLVFVALAAVHQAITATGRNADYWAVGAGIALGLLGMTQWTLTLLTITIVTVAYVAQRRYRDLAVTGVVGGIFSTHLLFLPPSSEGLMFSGFIGRLMPDSGGLIETSHALSSAFSPGFLLITIGVILVAILQRRTKNPVSQSGVLTVAIGMLYPMYLASVILNLRYIDWVVVQILIPVVYIGGIITVWRTANRVLEGNRSPSLLR